MQCRVAEVAFAATACRTRLPFRFGAVTLTDATLLHARVRVETADGRSGVGLSSDLLVPRWFRKDIDRPAQDDVAALRTSAQAAAAAFLGQGPRRVWEQWRAVHDERVESLPATDPELLERGFGVALIERALIDAACRAARMPFWSALQENLFGIQPLGPIGVDGWTTVGQLLRDTPLRRLDVRHTVGRLDPLRAADIPPAERLDDGMPQALDEVLGRHGVRWLKIKIGGGNDADRARLCAIGELLDDLGCKVQVTLDGNEQFADIETLRALWLTTGEDARGRSLLQRVRWVEQPLPRAATAVAGRNVRDHPNWPFCPLVLDEGDTRIHAAVLSGYGGVSVKNCKGVFRALANREWVRATGAHFQTSEDLTNLPVVALQQDLLTAAVLGLTHSERNGHHYFAGLRHLPPTVVAAALAAHPDLYEPTPDGARLRIDAGALAIGSLQTIGYGVDQAVIDALDTALPWQRAP
jgi:hypothetical protein